MPLPGDLQANAIEALSSAALGVLVFAIIDVLQKERPAIFGDILNRLSEFTERDLALMDTESALPWIDARDEAKRALVKVSGAAL